MYSGRRGQDHPHRIHEIKMNSDQQIDINTVYIWYSKSPLSIPSKPLSVNCCSDFGPVSF